MREQIARVRELGEPLLPPATDDELAALRAVLGADVPEAVQQLYADHGGAVPGSCLPMRLLSPDEACQTIPAIRQFGVPFADDELGVFWHDDDSNYAGVFTAGPLRGLGFLLDHDEPNPEPRWRSVESFYDALLHARQEDLGWSEMRTDYPRDLEDENGADDALATRLFTLHLADPDGYDGVRAGLQALALSSTAHADTVLALLDSRDMWIQEKAAQLLGRWRWAEAVEPLAEVARRGLPNGRLAAVLALQKIRTRGARVMVDTLRRELGPNYAPYFR